MATITTAKRRRGSSSAATVLLLTGAGRLHQALAFGSFPGNAAAHAGTFTTVHCGTSIGVRGTASIGRNVAAAAPYAPSALQHGIGIGIALTALHAETPGGAGGGATGGSWSSSPASSRHAQSRRDHKTAMEGAILVEWEPISELERRIEDGIHYEHFPDFEHMRQQARTARRGRSRSGGGGSRGGRADADQVDATTDRVNTNGEMDDADVNLESAQGVFVGFRVTEEEVDRLRSADPADYSV